MNTKSTIQGIAIGAALTAAVMIGIPALLSAHQPTENYTQIAEDFGVTIVWTPVTPCAITGGTHVIGCFVPTTPNTIYVQPNLPEGKTRYSVLHEIGHVMQWRLGRQLGECAADRFAQSLGSTGGNYCPAVPDNYRLQSN